MNNGENEFFRVVEEEKDVTTVLEIYERTVRPISDTVILKTSEKCVTVKVKQGSVLRINSYIFVWNSEKKVLEVQC